MTDLTLSQFGSLSKRELHRLLKKEEAEMRGSHTRRAAGHGPGPSSARSLRLISADLQIPLSLKRKLLPNRPVRSRT